MILRDPAPHQFSAPGGHIVLNSKVFGTSALFATALGLVAAIQAVVAYNKISHDLDRFAQRLEGFSSEFIAILSRWLEEGHE